MKCKRLSAWLLSLVMMFSLLPVSAAAVKWYDKHSVTVKYEFKDDSSNSKPDDVKRTIASTEGAIIAFKVKEPGYNHSAKVTSGKADCSIDDLGFLHVKHVDADSVITVTYTPKDNYIYIDKYFGNGGIFSKWDGENIKLNGYEFVENNALPKKYVIENHKLAPAMEKYRFLTVTNADNSTTVYDFSYAVVIPKTSESTSVKIKDVWYDRDAGEWYYSYDDPLGLFDKVLLRNEGGVNFCYNKEHNEDSEYHDFVATTTVDPTCEGKGYTVYQCAYCTETEKREYTGPLGHQWGDWVHVDGTEKENSKHQRVCQRCNKKEDPENCKFKSESTETGTKYTCTVCGHSYTDEITPTETPVYVYFKTVHSKDGNVRVNDGDGVTYNNNTGGWATLGKLVTTTVVTADKKDILGAKVIAKDGFTYHSDNNLFDLDLIESWDELKEEKNGAAGYVEEAPLDKKVWHLNGKVNVYKLSYDPNLPAGVGEAAVTGMPKPAYYLPDWEAPVSTDVPKLQGYDFGGWYKEREFVTEAKGTVAVTEDTVLYAKWTPAQPTADLIDDAITIYHQVNSEADWHGGNAYADASAHQAGRTPTISYKAELDLSEMKLQENNRTASIIAAYGENPWDKLVKAVKTAQGSLAMFSGSKIVLHVQLDKQLSTADIQKQLNKITVTSNWFELSKAGNPVVYDENAQSLTITCVPKNKADGYRSTITLSGLNDLSLTAKAQNELRSDKDLDIISEGYIDGTIMISKQALKLESKTAKNTAKLYWKEIKDNDDDDDDKYFFAIQKVDAQDDHALNGAVFELYQRDSRDNKLPASRKTTAHWGTESGIALFSVSATKTSNGGSTWYYREITAPEGYVLDRTEHKIKATNFSDSRSTAVQNAVTVRNYRGTTPDLLNDSDHFAYVIGYMDGNVRPYGLISRAETTTIFFRLLKDSVRDGNLLTSNTYTDVADDYWANTAISTMTGLGIVQGRSTTTFDPKAPITRAQFAAICARFDTGKSSGTQSFTDIKGHWAEKYIQRAAELGWIKGFEDGTFRPDTYITRAQAMTMINRVLNRTPDDEDDLLDNMNVWPDCTPNDWFYLAVQEATNSHDFKYQGGEVWTKLTKAPDWSRYEH